MAEWRDIPPGEGLVEALKPFLSWAEDNVEADPKNPAFGVWGGNRCEDERIKDWFVPTDFYRLRQALAAHQGPGGGWRPDRAQLLGMFWTRGMSEALANELADAILALPAPVAKP